MTKYFISILALLSIFVLANCNKNALTSYASLQNTTQFVGNKSCQSCHKKIYDSYVETGMGKSFYRPNKQKTIETFEPNTIVYDKFSNYYYHPYWAKDSMFVLEYRLEGNDTIHKRVEKIDYIVGSGNQTRSYILERNGYFYEVPITWYVNKKIWDLSPGYHEGNNSRFNREIGEECMACHTGNFEFVKGSKHRFRNVDLGIDCERCHGPGSAHVERMNNKDEIDVGKEIDYSIVNPSKLSIDKQFDVCQQCHLQGTNVIKTQSVRDFRPAMNLKDVYDVFLKEPKENEFGIASHAGRLKESQCFIQSNGKLTCTTCHNPHESVQNTDPNFYIKQCQKCHTQNTCKETEEHRMLKQNNCVACHLPQGGTNDIPHVSFHDHKIRVVKDLTNQDIQQKQAYIKLICATNDKVPASQNAKAHLQYFENHLKHDYYLIETEKGLGDNDLYEKAQLAFYKGKLEEAKTLAEKAIEKKDKQEGLGLFLLGEIYENQNNFSKAFDYYEKVYLNNQEAIEAGIKAGTMLLKANIGNSAILPQAQTRFELLLRNKPNDERILSNLGFVLMNQQKFLIAEKYLLKAFVLNPDYAPACENLIYLYLAQQNKEKAKFYFDKLVRINPKYEGKENIMKALGQ